MIFHKPLVTPYGDTELGEIGSGKGLLPDGTKPLLELMLTYHQWNPAVFTLRQFNWKCSRNQSLEYVAKLQINGLVQDCSNSIANALELLQSCTEPSIWYRHHISHGTLSEDISCQAVYSNLLVCPWSSCLTCALLMVVTLSRWRHFGKIPARECLQYHHAYTHFTHWGQEKWLTFCRWHFQMHFRESKLLILK